MEIAKLLLDVPGIDVNEKLGESRSTALMIAAEQKYESPQEYAEIVKKLLSLHADIDVQDWGGVTALMIAAGQDDEQIVGLLLAKNASLNIKDAEGHTALWYAQQSKSPNKDAIIKLLKDKGATE